MKGPTVLLAGVRTQTEAHLRAAFPEVDFLAQARPAPDPGRAPAPVAVLGLDADLEGGYRAVRQLAGAGTRVLVLGPAKDADLILRAMREGAREYAVADDAPAVERALREQLRPYLSACGFVCAVFAAKGGVGATTVATNLAAALQRHGEQTCLVDLNLEMGDVLAFLDLPGGFSISDALANARRLDRELLHSSLDRHASGVAVLAQSHRLEEADQVADGAIRTVLSCLRPHFPAVVLDGLRGFGEQPLAAIDAADQILLVVTQEVPAVRNARRCVDLFRRLGADQKVKVVVNRFQPNLEIGLQVVAETVGLPAAATIANDYPAVVRAVNKGQLLVGGAPRSQVSRDVEKLVEVLGLRQARGGERERRSFLQRFFTPRISHATE